MTLDLDALEKLADEATPGPWFAGPLRPESEYAGASISVGPFDLAETYGRREDYSPEAFDSHYEETILECWDDNHDAIANAAFIAAANPATIKAVIAELREARGLLSNVHERATEGHKKSGCDNWRAVERCRQIANLTERAFLSRAQGEG